MAKIEEPEVFDRAFALYLKGEYSQAYDLLTEAASSYPERAQRLYEWRFDLAAKMGKLELAEEILEDALDSGYFYGEFALRKDEDMQALQGRPFFEALVTRSFRMLEDAQVYSRPRLEVINSGFEQEGVTPLFISLHGNSTNLDHHRPYWKCLEGSEWLVALPQSSQVGGKDIYVWNDMSVVDRELQEHYRKLAARTRFDPAKTILSGFSKGGYAAIRAALSGILPVNAFIAIAPYMPDLNEMKSLLDACSNRDLRGYLLLGGEDESCTPGALQFHQELEKRGFKCGVEVFPGLHHEFPDDFPNVLTHAMDFVLNRQGG